MNTNLQRKSNDVLYVSRKDRNRLLSLYANISTKKFSDVQIYILETASYPNTKLS